MAYGHLPFPFSPFCFVDMEVVSFIGKCLNLSSKSPDVFYPIMGWTCEVSKLNFISDLLHKISSALSSGL